MIHFRPAVIATVALAAAIIGNPAHATLVAAFGTMTFTNLIDSAELASGSSLLATSSVILPSGTTSIARHTVSNFYLQSSAGITIGGLNNINTLPVVSGAAGSAVTLSSTTITPTMGYLTVDVGPLVFVLTSETSTYTTLGNGASLTYAFNGTLTTDTSNAVITPSSVEFIITVTQATIGSGSISYTANLDVPGPMMTIPVPEPISLAILGTGIVGVGLIRRHRA